MRIITCIHKFEKHKNERNQAGRTFDHSDYMQSILICITLFDVSWKYKSKQNAFSINKIKILFCNVTNV